LPLPCLPAPLTPCTCAHQSPVHQPLHTARGPPRTPAPCPLQEKFGVALQVLASFKGAVLDGCAYRHPLAQRQSPVVVGGDYITTDAGTGLVHTAPGHGQEDYQVGTRRITRRITRIPRRVSRIARSPGGLPGGWECWSCLHPACTNSLS